MNKRWLLAGLAALPFIGAANASGKNSASWRVPAGITKIRVRSWTAKGVKDLDRTLTVEPGDVFRIDAIED
jgi:protein-disulfide isomerase